MAQKNKNYYISVMCGYKLIYEKMMFGVKEANQLFQELKQKYPSPEYVVSKDYY